MKVRSGLNLPCMVGFCEHGNVPSRSIKMGKIVMERLN